MANTMNLHRVVVAAIWTNLEESPINSDRDGDNAYVGEGETIDSSRIDMRQMADGVLMALDEANTVRTVDALHALPIPTPDDLARVLIRTIALVDPNNGNYGLGEVYERNTDGTWCMLQDPSGADWGERQVASADIPLPAIVLWSR